MIYTSALLTDITATSAMRFCYMYRNDCS